jgi:HSP20 family protein
MLAYWDPFAEMSRLHDRFFNGGASSEQSRDFGWRPAVDIYEDDAGVHVKADLAGVKPEDVKVSVENGVLSISGERKLERTDERDAYHRVERFYGKFNRSFALSDDVNAEDIDAKLENGVLALTLKKRPAAKRREIEIKAS